MKKPSVVCKTCDTKFTDIKAVNYCQFCGCTACNLCFTKTRLYYSDNPMVKQERGRICELCNRKFYIDIILRESH